MGKTSNLRLLTGLAMAGMLVGAGCEDESEPTQTTSEEQDLVGGSAESRWRAVGYIAAAGEDDVLCGGTLIASNVAVTAAHCLYRSRELPLDFGVGEVEDGERVAIRSYTVHPDAHLE